MRYCDDPGFYWNRIEENMMDAREARRKLGGRQARKRLRTVRTKVAQRAKARAAAKKREAR